VRRRYITERLRTRHANREDPNAWQKVLRAYERQRSEAADEIDRLDRELSTVHACAADNEYDQWERIRELEEALAQMLRVSDKPTHDGAVTGGIPYKATREVLNRARSALALASNRVATIFCFH
jgi:hypothetical protein